MVNDISPLARRAASNLIALGQDVGRADGENGRENGERQGNGNNIFAALIIRAENGIKFSVSPRKCTGSATFSPYFPPSIERARAHTRARPKKRVCFKQGFQ